MLLDPTLPKLGLLERCMCAFAPLWIIAERRMLDCLGSTAFRDDLDPLEALSSELREGAMGCGVGDGERPFLITALPLSSDGGS